MSANVPASVKARLLNRARSQGDEFERVLLRYACERFLYRVGVSEVRGQLVLKGAALLTLWLKDSYRMTRDLDFLALDTHDEAGIRSTVHAICGLSCAPDGLTFDAAAMEISPIRTDRDFKGQRVALRANLGKARIPIQVDLGFGEAGWPAAEEVSYPTLITGVPAPSIRAYPPAAAVAEKLDAMVQHGFRNTRMKDFHDIWALSSELPFDGADLCIAVTACFERRRATWAQESPVALGSRFYAAPDLQRRWADYRRRGVFRPSPPPDFDSIGERVRAFLGPVWECVVTGAMYPARWPPGGPWA